MVPLIITRARWRADPNPGPDEPAAITHLDGDTQTTTLWGISFISGSYGSIYFDHWDKGTLPEDVICMPVAVVRPKYYSFWKKRLIIGLVLSQKSDGVVVRLGYFEAHKEEFMVALRKAERREVTIL